MSGMGAVLDLVRRTDRQFARTRRRYFWIKVAFLAFHIPAYLALLGTAIWKLTAVWYSSDWFDFGIPAVLALMAGTHEAMIWVWDDSRRSVFDPVARLRDAARTGDGELDPIAPAKADGRDTIDFVTPVGSSRIGPLRRPANASRVVLILMGVLLLLAALVVVPFLLAREQQSATLIVTATLVPLGALLVLSELWMRHPLYVRMTDEGLRWRRLSGRGVRLRWRDARSFVYADYPTFGFARVRHEAQYVLDAGEVVLAWRTPGQAADAPPDAVSSRLRQIITERTGLPLRDLSKEAQDLALEMDIEGLRPPSRAEVKRRFRIMSIVLAPALLVAVVGGVLRLAEPWYYGHLYAQAHAHSPIYADPLSAADGDWPETARATFADGAYHLTSDSSNFVLFVPAPHDAKDALFEVTLRMDGQSDSVAGAGLSVQGSSYYEGPQLAFRTTSKGGWWLEHIPIGEWIGHGETSQLGDSAAIHQGMGSANRIAVMVQGGTFTFFVNGAFVVAYRDDSLIGSTLGLYVYGPQESGSFRDFAVYPLV